MFKETITDPEQRLRAFSDTDCTEHLKVWYADGSDMAETGDICEFRLTYNAINDSHGILWRKKDVEGEAKEIYAHVGIDDGEDKRCEDLYGKDHRMPFKQATRPVLDGVFEERDVKELAEDFLRRAANIDQKVARFVYEKILAFPKEQYVRSPHR